MKLNSELLSILQVPAEVAALSAVVNMVVKPVDSALLIRPDSHYVMKDVADKTIYKNTEEAKNLKPDFIIPSLYALLP